MKTKPEGDVSTELKIRDNEGIFNGPASFTFSVKNPLANDQKGKISYLLTDENGDKVRAKTITVKIGKNSSASYNFIITSLKTGFYKLNLMINVSDYDDTTRRVFGIRPKEIQSDHPKPADFDQFWQKAKDELAKVKPDFKVTPMPKMNTENRDVYEIQMRSLGNYMIRGYMTLPKTKNKKRKFSVLLGLPGYQVDLEPMVGLDDDLAIITLNTRGQGTSRGEIDTRRDEFISYHIENKEKYVMRGVIMDCIRCVDFIYSQPNLQHDNILATGGSMGGYLALAVASLDKRVNLCSAQNPILCDVRGLMGEVDWPISSIKKYVATQPCLTMNKVLDNLDYFDGKNFASNVTCPTIMGIGLLDPFAPPNNEFATYNLIPGKKRIMVFKDLGHEISEKYKELEGRWMRDAFALF
ncbi:acetylxylan esterase [Mucilaginibacter sp. McL0603]|uniref:acetylxylan esterase n=1 Tax=Mucilaginibacter sp. McL0603 TaxID=3415670 RepID=UPI003CF4D7A4